MPAGNVAEPLDAVGEERDCVGECEALDGPPVITSHHLVQTGAFLTASNEQVAPPFRDADHEARLADEPVVVVRVVHEAGLIGDAALRLEAPANQDAGVTYLGARLELDLLLAR